MHYELVALPIKNKTHLNVKTNNRPTEETVLLGNDTVFKGNIVSSSSRFKMSKINFLPTTH